MKKQHFNFKDYENHLPEHKKKLDSYFLIWFIGFTEGDGSFISYIPKSTTRSVNQFIIVQKDPKVLYYIKKNLGFGVVKQRKDGYFYYSVNDQINIDRLIRIFNGNILVEEVSKKFEEWFPGYESYTKFQDKVRFIPFDADRSKSLLTLDNPWLCGFTDAEGSFNGRMETPKRVRLKFSIKQLHSPTLLINLRSLFGFFSPDGKKYVAFEITKKVDLHRISNYFCVHKLKSNKRISYLRWRRVLFLKDEGDKTDKSIKKLERLAKNINNF